jgi:ATP-binding cassette, subfamily B, multidrug efflux pump
VLFERLHVRAVIVLLSLFAAFFGVSSPLFQKLFIDRLMGIGDTLTGGYFNGFPIWAFIFGTFFSLLLGGACNTFAVWIAAKEAMHFQAIVSETVYRKTLRMRSDQLGHRPVGEIVALYATDVPGSTQILEMTLPMAAGTIFPLILAPIAVRFIADIPLFNIFLLSALTILMNVILSRRQSRFFYLFKHLAAERTGIVNEWIQNIRLLRILGWTENYESKIQAKRIEETINRVRMVTNGQTMNSFGSTISFFINIVGVATLISSHHGEMNPGQIFAMLWIFGVFLARPFRQIPWMFTMGLDALTSIRRVEKFLSENDEGEESTNQERRKRVDDRNAAIDVKGMRLAINNNILLRGIDFKVENGEWVAVVGEVGSGKTLFLLSLMGETGAQFDHYYVGGHDVLKWSVNDRRSLYSFVPQEGFVMSATLRENVALEYEHGSANDLRILETLRLSQFDVAQERVPGGLNAEIGERGVNLSGGQRQRVSLGRAEYFTRPLLLLDDCLSAVDTETEKKLIESLMAGRWNGRTRILVTHRLTVLDHVDRVLFLDDGQIQDQGKFRELLARNEKFRAFAASVADKKAKEEAALEIPLVTETINQEDLSGEN